MKKALTIVVLALMALTTTAQAKGRETVTLRCELHCQGCIDKIMHNIAYEKGVKDIECNLEQQTVVVTYDPDKTNVEQLQQAFAKIKKPATIVSPETDAQSGATTRATE